MNRLLANKVILVTGGEGLIGKAIVKDITDKGGVAINADVSFEATNLDENKIKIDVTNERSVLAALDLIRKHYKKLDGIVNNAYPRTPDFGDHFEEMKSETWSKNVNYQLNSTFFCIQKTIPFLRETKGAIVNLGSIYGVVGSDLNLYEGTEINSVAPYSAIKGGIINFSRYLASIYAKEGIRVNVVSPGGIFNNQDPKFVEQYKKKVPMKRMGRPEDIAPIISFLLSNEAAYITGQNILVDGGWTCI